MIQPTKPRLENLVKVQMGQHRSKQDTSQLNVITVNCRSVKFKSELIHSLMLEQRIDVAILTETWLQDSDDLWIKTCDLNTSGLTMMAHNRATGRGGGLAIVTTSRISSLKWIQRETTKTFEMAHWELMVNDTTYNILAV